MYLKIEAARRDMGWAEPGGSVKSKKPYPTADDGDNHATIEKHKHKEPECIISKVSGKKRNKYYLAISRGTSIVFVLFLAWFWFVNSVAYAVVPTGFIQIGARSNS